MIYRDCLWPMLLLLPIVVNAGQTVKYSATDPQAIALPPQAVPEVRVEDVSRAGARAELIAQATVGNPGRPPFLGEIDVDPQKLDLRHSYPVRATIRAQGRLLMTGDQVYPVLTRGYGDAVERLLRPVGGPPPGPGQIGEPPLRREAASFSGDLPCADCEGIRYRLNLFPDRAFYLGTAYLGRGGRETFDLGSWDLSSNGRILILQGGREAPLLFRVSSPDALTRLDLQGDDIDSALNYSLRRTPTFERIEPRLPMRGMYEYMADAGLFTECLTGQRWPVAQVEDNLALERAYLRARSRPAEPVLVSLEAGVEVREDMEPDVRRPMLVPYRFMGVSPGAACAERFATLSLEDARWRLTQLQGEPVLSGEGLRVPELMFDGNGHRLYGSDGCNRLTGSYELERGQVRLDPVGATRVTCPDDDGMQRRFAEMLARVESWNLLGRQLEFYDARGQRLARLEAISAEDQ